MIEFIKKVNLIALKAGQAIMEIYDNVEDFGIEIKKDDSPLTKADQAANEIICKGLEALEYEFPIISEENKQIAYTDRKDYDYFWLVDPLDGTKEFIKRNGEFTVNIALIKKDRPVAGVVYLPVKQELYYALEGHGAYKIVGDVESKISSQTFKETQDNLKIVCSRSHINEDTENFISKYTNHEKVACGSSLKFIIIARGDAHVYPRLGPTMEWDTAAAHAVLNEAGGEIIDHTTGVELKYNKESLLNPYFIAYGKRDKH